MSVKKFYNIGKFKLFPICRSLTGEGVRKTLRIIKKEFSDLKIQKVRSGTKVFDWRVPPEWNVKNAYVIDKFKSKIIDFKKNNLHLVGYSTPLNKKITKNEFFNHLHSLEKQKNAIPYATSYYKKYWGFCVTHKDKKNFDKKYNRSDKFHAVIKSNFKKKGLLNYGELFIKGKSKQEILISTNICHPSLANNELSGPIVSMCLINHFLKKKKQLKKSLRFLFIPETVGAISYISKNLNKMKRDVIGGYNLSCIGDEKNHSFMYTKEKNTLSDQAIIYAYKKLKIKKYKRFSFLKRGSDERQYNSPGIDLPIASIFRTRYGNFPEYHTSLDNFKLVTINGIKGGFNVAKIAIENLMDKIIPKYLILGEPQLGKRGLYPSFNTKYSHANVRNYMDFLQYSDGKNDLKMIGKKTNINKNNLVKIYNTLKSHKLVI